MASKEHRKKIIAPVIIVVLVVLYFIGYFIGCTMLLELSLWVMLVAAILPLGLAGVAIAALVQRVKEIRSGEEDDLSQY